MTGTCPGWIMAINHAWSLELIPESTFNYRERGQWVPLFRGYCESISQIMIYWFGPPTIRRCAEQGVQIEYVMLFNWAEAHVQGPQRWDR